MLKRIALALAAAAWLAAGAAQVSAVQSPAERPIVLLISFDGWRWDYTDRASAPNLRALARRGVRSEGLIPAFPSKTFPNHYTIVTGLYPAHHGIVSNNMRDAIIGERFSMSAPTSKDPRWWGGEPLWVTAIRQKQRAASMFWPGSEVEIGGVRPTDWKPYDDNYPNSERVWQVLEWLSRPEAERPAFVTMYFSDLDTAGHTYGPEAPETLAAAARVDGLLGDLLDGIEKRGLSRRTTVIVVSDHGMSQQAVDRKIFLDDYIDPASVEVIEWSPVLQVAPKAGTEEALYRALHGKHPALEVYRRADVPAYLHYSAHPRIPPVIGLAADGWTITTRARFEPTKSERRHSGGEHGYDGRYRSMHGLFVAAGPGLRQGLTVPAFDNVHLYEFMCRILGLRPAKNDGDGEMTRAFSGSSAIGGLKPADYETRQEAPDLTGTWTGTLTSITVTGQPDEDPAHLVLKQTGAELTGTGGPTPDRQTPIRDGKVTIVKDVTTVTFTVAERDGEVPAIHFDLKLVDGRLKGTARADLNGRPRTATVDLGRVK